MAENSSGTANRIAEARVEDRMTREVITIKPSDSCERALVVMRKSFVKHLPVLEGKRLVGILTEHDIQRRLPRIRVFGSTNEGKLLTLVKVGGVMTYGPVTVPPALRLSEAAAIMLKQGIGSLPVVQHGNLVGILTSKDTVG